MSYHTWFIFSFAFICILFLFILMYIIIPYIVRKRNNSRRQKRILKNIYNLKRIDEKHNQEKIKLLESINIKLKTDLEKDLLNFSKNKFDKINFETFFANFEKLYPKFKNSLLKQSSNLTANEIKLCAFLRLNLSSKEISNLLNITPESVNKARYRLRKKLQLSSNDDLSTHILKL